jgi:glycosyltransferase involved in cell wall biosynthesis
MAATRLHVAALHGGGVDRHLRDIARAVPGRHLFLHVGDRAVVLEDPAKRRHWALDAGRIAADPAPLATALSRDAVGLVHRHASSLAPRLLAGRLAGALGAPEVVTLHDILFLRPDGFDAAPDAPADPAWLEANVQRLRAAKAVLAPSEFLAALARHHIPGLAFDVLPNGSSPLPARAAQARPVFAYQRPRHVVALLGAIGPHKGSDLVEELAPRLKGTGIGLVVIGYLDRQLYPGWRHRGTLFVHGAYDDADAGALLDAYRARLVLFPNRVPESFSYALSDAWSAGVPVLAADAGALGERVRAHGGGWLLETGFDAQAVERRLIELLGDGEALAQVESALTRPDAARVPSLEAMARSLDALYRRFAIDPAQPAADAGALEALVAASVDSSVFRPELARLADEFAQVKAALDGERGRTEAFERESRAWVAKLERDVADLTAQLEREVAERRRLGEEVVQLGIHKAAFDLLPGIVRKILLKKVLGARG